MVATNSIDTQTIVAGPTGLVKDYVDLLNIGLRNKIAYYLSCCAKTKYSRLDDCNINAITTYYSGHLRREWVKCASSPLNWGQIEADETFAGFGKLDDLKHKFRIEVQRNLLVVRTHLGTQPFPTFFRPGGYGMPLRPLVTDAGSGKVGFSYDPDGSPYELMPCVDLVKYKDVYVVSWHVDENRRLIKFDRDSTFWTITNATFETVRAAFNDAGVTLGVAYVGNHYLSKENVDTAWRMQVAARLVAYFGGTRYGEALQYFNANVTLGGVTLDNSHKDYATSVCPPATTSPAVLPSINDSMDVLAVEKRILAVNPVAQGQEPDLSSLEDLKLEFIAHMRGICNDRIVPIDAMEVVDQQRTKATREKNLRAIEEWPEYGDLATIKAFLKKETYPKINDPRNISDIDAKHNLMGFRYLLPLKKILVRMPFYAPGRNPRDVGTLVVDYVGRVRGAGFDTLEGDYSRYDGSQTEAFRRIPFDILKEFIATQHQPNWDKLVNAHFQVVARTAIEKRPYDTFGSMISGSFMTTDGNTLGAAFVSYVALRKFGEFKPGKAWKYAGLAFGDDTITTGKPEWHQQAAKICGLVLKMEEANDHVSFLSRTYPLVGASNHSAPVVKRALDKIHIIPRLIPDNELKQMMHQKLSSILLLGPNTPLLSNYCRAVLRIQKLEPLGLEDVEFEQYWLKECTDPIPFEPLEPGEWNYIAFITAVDFGISFSTLKKYCSIMDNAKTLDELNNLVHSPPGNTSDNYFLNKDYTVANEIAVQTICPATDAKREAESQPKDPQGSGPSSREKKRDIARTKQAAKQKQVDGHRTSQPVTDTVRASREPSKPVWTVTSDPSKTPGSCYQHVTDSASLLAQYKAPVAHSATVVHDALRQQASKQAIPPRHRGKSKPVPKRKDTGAQPKPNV